MSRRAILLSSLSATVIAVAVIVFLILHANSGNTGTTQTTTSTPAPAGTGSGPPSAGVPAGLGKAISERITDVSAAGQFMVDFFETPGSERSWSMLTPAAQAVYGSQQAFAAYWNQHKITDSKSARADKGGPDGDGSITMYLTLNGGPRPGWRIVKSGGQFLIDSDTRVF